MKELIAIVGLGRVRILSISRGGDDPNDRDHLVEELNEDLEGVGGPLRDTVSDQAGQFGKRGGKGAAGSVVSTGEEHNLQSERERAALANVAARVAVAVGAAGYPAWRLVAPQDILRRMINELPKRCQDTVVETIAGNLTKMPVVELEKRLLR